MNQSFIKFIIAALIVFSISTLTFIARGTAELGPLGQLPEMTKVFNKIFYGTDEGKSASEMLSDSEAVPYNAQTVCEGDNCYTWNAFLDKDSSTIVIGFGDIKRKDSEGNDITSPTISCPSGQGIYDIDDITGEPTCTPIRTCYVTVTANNPKPPCIAGMFDSGTNTGLLDQYSHYICCSPL